MKAYGERGVEIHIFLTSALVGSEWSASRPSRLCYFVYLYELNLFLRDKLG
jgi:hypothetical protein